MNSDFADLSPFFNDSDFAVECRRDGVLIGMVTFDTPDSENFGGMVMSADAKIQGATSELSVLEEGDEITVDGQVFEVKTGMRRIDDGLLSEVFLVRRA